MFDYSLVNEQTKEVTFKPFSEQAVILQEQVDSAVADYFETIVIIGQSQGCLTPSYCDASRVNQVIGISPLFTLLETTS